MPTLKTEVSELSVAFGILGVKPINPVLSEEEISTKFENTLPYDKYIKYCEGIEKKTKNYINYHGNYSFWGKSFEKNTVFLTTLIL